MKLLEKNYIKITISILFIFIITLFISTPMMKKGFIILFGAMLIPLLMNYIKVNYIYKKIILSALAVFAVIILYPINKDVQVYFSWQNRAIPTQFFSDKGKENRSELYLQIRGYLDTLSDVDKVDVLYKSNVDFHAYSTNQNLIIKDEVVKAPVYSATITISEKTFLQIPFIYYDGFKVKITNIRQEM